MKKYFLRNIKFLFVFTIGFQIYAQNVNGVVLGEEGPLPGATFLVKGSNIGTTTDFDGNFSIEASQNDILVISFIGFSTQEVTIGNQTDLTISLLPNTELD